ncbi:MAG: MBL fold metallo-hydrolase [Lachnospiraceae bacterium]|nr:MBL fold metallo-hydrolase [Lachnospiraceae bacterium]
MKITYIDHSGFLVELSDCYLIFDYYRGELRGLAQNKPVLVFVSHAHQDHYNREIFSLLKKYGIAPGDIHAFLSKEIYVKKIPQDISYTSIRRREHYELPFGIRLDTMRSTDAGVAFLLQTPEGILYHAGDLNDWTWAGESKAYNHNMTAQYQKEIDRLKELVPGIDVAFLPLDPRQEADYDRGMLYFLQNIPVKKVFPMHYWGHNEVIGRFLEAHPEYGGIVCDTQTALRLELKA